LTSVLFLAVIKHVKFHAAVMS